MMQRISIVGNTGTGKSTLAKQLSEMLDLEWVSLDNHFWLQNWQERSRDEVISDIRDEVVAEKWVMEGNFSWMRPIIWDRADTVIWLDYPLPFTFVRLFIRTIRRNVKNEEVCNGNFESWSKTFGRESILLWCLKSYKKRYAHYPEWIARPEYAHINFYVFRSPSQTQLWLRKLTAAKGARQTST